MLNSRLRLSGISPALRPKDARCGLRVKGKMLMPAGKE
jgi:hypothetical protein